MKSVLISGGSSDQNRLLTEFLRGNYEISYIGFDRCLQKIEDELPDLLLLSSSPDETSASDLLLSIKNNENSNHIPVIVITRKYEYSVFRNFMNHGADDVLPLTSGSDLLLAIETQLWKNNTVKNSILTFQEKVLEKIPHDLRTPLVPMMGYIDLLGEQLEDEDIKEIVASIKLSAIKLSSRINKFLLLKDLSVGNSKTQWQNRVRRKCRLSQEIVEKTVFSAVRYLDRRPDFLIDVRDANVLLDGEYLQRVISELAENSCKYSEKGSSVVITGRQNAGHYVLRFTDYGIGMKLSEIRSLSAFNKFRENYMSDSGMGLGLTLVMMILEYCNGSIEFESEPGNYTIITARIPLAEAAETVHRGGRHLLCQKQII